MASYADKPWLKSYKLGPFKLQKTIEYPNKPLFAILDEAAEQFPGKDAYHYLGRRMKYHELKRQSDALANALANLGVKKGDRVIVFLPTCPQFIISDFAILKAGAVLVPCSPILKAPELKHQAQESGTETIICLNTHLKLINSIIAETRIKNIIITSLEDFSPSESQEIKDTTGTYQLRKLILDHEPEAPNIEIDPTEDLPFLLLPADQPVCPKGSCSRIFKGLRISFKGFPG